MSFERSPNSSDIPEILSYELRMAIIQRVHDGVGKVRELDQKYELFQRRHGLPLVDRYLITSPANDEVLMPHYRVTLAPKRRTQVLDGVASVRLRVPIVQRKIEDGTDEYLANDIFIANILDGGHVARYLLTPREFQPYADPEKVVVDTDGQLFGNLFTVHVPEDDAPVEPTVTEQTVEKSPHILLSEYEMLLREQEIIWQYQPVVQDNRPTHDAL